MTTENQLQNWVNGRSFHNHTTDEHCPDFSCCIPEIETPLTEKIKFREAFSSDDDIVQAQMLLVFIGRALPYLGG